MNKTRTFGILAMCLAALWVFALCSGARAQGKGQQKDRGEKNRKKSEQVMEKSTGKNAQGKTVRKEKGKAAKEAAEAEKYIEGKREGAAKVKPAVKPKYKPKSMTERNMTEWVGGNPPGWSHGKKTGWGGAGAPPGQMKKEGTRVAGRDYEMINIYPPQAEEWDAKKKEAWTDRIKRTRADILERMKKRGDATDADRESVSVSLEGAAGRGVPVETAGSVIDHAVERRLKGEDIEKVTRAMAYGADKNTDYNKLGRFVNRKIDSGETGNDIAVSVYKEIDSGSMAKKKPWYKRLFGR